MVPQIWGSAAVLVIWVMSSLSIWSLRCWTFVAAVSFFSICFTGAALRTGEEYGRIVPDPPWCHHRSSWQSGRGVDRIETSNFLQSDLYRHRVVLNFQDLCSSHSNQRTSKNVTLKFMALRPGISAQGPVWHQHAKHRQQNLE